MSITKDLFLSILSMDSYNRGYNAGIEIDAVSVGLATIGADSSILLDNAGNPRYEDINFYAIAYDYNGETIISYRGTDDVGFFDRGTGDFWTGWLFGTGLTAGTQLELAREFYEAVTELDPFESQAFIEPTTTVTLTGHSLGSTI